MGKESRFKIQKTQTVETSGKIIPSKLNDPERVSFNFRRLCEKQQKFCYTNKETNYFVTLLERLRDVCQMTKNEMTGINRRSLRCHEIDFKNTDVSEDTFGILGDDVDDDAWQFQISSNEHGRVHGYFVGSVFYIVWLDPNHELSPG